MTNTTKQGWLNDALLSIGPFINTGIYWLLAVSYNILLLIANSELFTSETIIQIFNRVQLVIGVFMVFRLTMLVLQGIINPDTFTDSKAGASNIIVKIITSLALLTLLVPINIPKSASEMNSFEKRINNNGLLFGILYDFQYRVLSQNLLGNLILGTGATDSEDNVLNSGDSMASDVLKSFFTPNLKTSNYKYNSNGHYDDDDLFCEDYDYEKFYKTKNPSAILGMATESCDLKESSGMGGYEGYAFNFSWFISLIVAIIFVVILLGMAVEVAKRAVKIAILRLIAPIPIISYMNPKTSMDNGSFGSWVKTLSSTYIDLFINITIIYFAIFMINQIANGQLQFINSVGQKIGGFTILMAKIFIFIGILLFAKEAPKFIKQALGMKDEGGKGWFSGIAAAAGLGAAGIGAIGSAIANFQASREENPPGKNLRVRNFGSALIGGMSGMVTGGKAALTAKDHNFKAATDAMRNRNEQRLSGYTPARNIKTRLAYAVTGNGSSKKYEDIMSDQKAFADYYKHAVGKADVDSTNLSTIGIGGYGNESVKSLKENFERLKIAGADTATLKKAEDRYKNAQAALVGAVIKGRHTSGQASQIKLDYDKAMEISRKYDNTDNKLDMTLNVSGMADEKIAEEWKGAQFTAIDNAYKVEHSDEYAKAKLNDQNSKK